MWGLEQLDPVEYVPAHCRALEWDELQSPFQPKPFYEDKQCNIIDFSPLEASWDDFNKASEDAVKKLVPDKLQKCSFSS